MAAKQPVEPRVPQRPEEAGPHTREPGPAAAAPDPLPAPVAAIEAGPPASAAAGLGAALSTLRIAFGKMGPIHGPRVLLRLNQPDGFDCPGCAWPEPEARSRLEFCENGVKHIAHETTKKRVTPEWLAQHSIPELMGQSDRWLEAQGRLTHPVVRRPGSDHYEPITWAEAFALAGQTVAGLDSPEQVVFYTSGRTSNEAAFLYQLLARQLGTNNLPDCSNLCHESSGKALSATIGVGKGTVGLADFEQADAILVIGQNPGSNHPRMLTTLQAAARRGCRIVSINPLREPGLVRFKHPKELRGLFGRGTALAEQFLQVRINGDAALLQGISKAVLEEEDRRPGRVLDREFLDVHTKGFEAFAAAMEATPWATIERASGISHLDIEHAAAIYCRAERVIACWAMGVTQHKNAVATIQEIVNLLLLRGQIGRPGAGVCPVRGHSNVQGDRTMGIWESPSKAFLDRLGEAFAFEPPRRPGFNTVQAIQAMHDGRARVFVGLGGNFAAATPDTAYTWEALRRCALTVHVSTTLNRSHLTTGETALILPCLSRSEVDAQASGPQMVSCENSMSLVHTSRGRFAPASEHLESEPAIVAGLARALLGDRTTVDWEGLVADYDGIRDAIERVVPGFEAYNERVRQPGGFLLPNGARERRFDTASGKAELTVHPIETTPLEPGQLLMMTIRSHDQFNTTIYTDDDRYRGLTGGRRVVLMHPEDLAERGLSPHQLVDLTSHFQGQERTAASFVALPYDLPRGCAATYFPEANALVPIDSVADLSWTPTSKSVVISVRPAS